MEHGFAVPVDKAHSTQPEGNTHNRSSGYLSNHEKVRPKEM